MYASNVRDLRLSEQVRAMKSSEAISLVDTELAFNMAETVCVSTIRGDVMSDVSWRIHSQSMLSATELW